MAGRHKIQSSLLVRVLPVSVCPIIVMLLFKARFAPESRTYATANLELRLVLCFFQPVLGYVFYGSRVNVKQVEPILGSHTRCLMGLLAVRFDALFDGTGKFPTGLVTLVSIFG